MKKIIILFCTCSVLFSLETFAQSCLPGGITFNTQAQIDNFGANYPNCSEIEGNVIISGNDITNLNGLNPITKVGGSLAIVNNDALTSLVGLSNLEFVGGLLSINNNLSLTTLTALINLVHVGDAHNVGLLVRDNPVLTSLSGLKNVSGNLLGSLSIKDNSVLCHCNILGVCGYLNGSDPAIILGNATGCASVSEVEAACANPVACLSPSSAFSNLDHGNGSVSFYDQSSGPIDTWDWTFGDGNGSNSTSPSHTYATGGMYEVCLTVTNNTDSDMTCQMITLVITSLFDLPDGNNIEIWPNPTNGKVNIYGIDHENLEVRVRDVTGNLCKSQNLNAKGQIDLTGYPAGVYLIELQIKGQIISRRIIKG